MNDRFKNKYRIASTRLNGWDYGSNGLYFITLCTLNRQNYFGEIVAGQDVTNELPNSSCLQKTIIGEVAHKNWLEIPDHFTFIELDEFVIMPNHIHGIVFINKPNKTDWQVNKFGPQSQNLAAMIRGYKSSVKAYSTINNIEFGWQPRYYDRVIRNEKEYLNIRNYIVDNPNQWLLNGDIEDNDYKNERT